MPGTPGTVDAPTAPTAPWKTLRVFHKLPQGILSTTSSTDRLNHPQILLRNRKWKEVSCCSLEELRQLRADGSLRKTVLRLTLDMRLPLHEYDEAVRILAELEGSLAAHPKVGVLMTERDRLRLDVTDASSFTKDLPGVLQSVVRRLEAKAVTEPEKTERAIHHLYRLVQESR